MFAGGGETLLTKNLCDFLGESVSLGNVGQITVTTNGTIRPAKELLDLIDQNKHKFVINISDYSEQAGKRYSEKRDKVVAAFKEICPEKIIVTRPFWIKTSLPSIHKRNEQDLKNYFQECLYLHGAYFTSLWDGKISACPRQGIFDLMGYNVPQSDFVNLREFNSGNELRKELIDFFYKDFYHSYNYCNNVEDAQQELIRPGEQS